MSEQHKQHFLVLDGMRGLAAFAVVILHFMAVVKPDNEQNFIVHAYLSVDFFLCLSGFVIGYAYDHKLPVIGLKAFFRIRLIRLHPLVVIGSVLGLITFIIDPWSDLQSRFGWGSTLKIFVASCLLIPYPAVKERYANLFHLNPPTWSLFWEYIANIAYAFVLVRVSKKLLWVILPLATVWLFVESYREGHLSVGWAGSNFFAGGARVAFSFTAGLLIYRSGWRISNRLGIVGMGTLLMLAFICPFSTRTAWLVDPLLVVFYFPCLIILGASTPSSGLAAKFSKFSGRISYPLYMVHYPFIWLFFSYVEKFKPGTGELAVIVPGGLALLVLLAYGVMRWIDEPLRRRLG